jgi:hypothetical protein
MKRHSVDCLLKVSFAAATAFAIVARSGAAQADLEIVPDGSGSVQISNTVVAPLGSVAYTGNQVVALDGLLGVAGQATTDGAGAAQVFVGAGSGPIQAGPMLPTPSDVRPGDQFGWAVAVSAFGPTIVVGAPGHGSGAGAAYVFTEVAGAWQLESELSAPVPTAGDQFGYSVAVNGGLIVIGAPGTSTGPIYKGVGASYEARAAFVNPLTPPMCPPLCVLRDDGQCHCWSVVSGQNDPNGDAGDQFGISVGCIPPIPALGPDPLPMIAEQGGGGVAWVLSSGAAGGTIFNVTQVLFEDSASADGSFDSVAWGASQGVHGSFGGGGGGGKVRLHDIDLGGDGGSPRWTLKQTLTPPSGAGIAGFGATLAVSDSLVLVGDPSGALGSAEELSGPGFVYMFAPDASGQFVPRVHIQARNANGGLNPFGSAVALSGTRAMAVSQDTAGAGAQVYTFQLVSVSPAVPALGWAGAWLAVLLATAGAGAVLSRRRGSSN